MRRAPKLDLNHREIVDTLRGVGASVLDLARVGHDCPDILVGYRGRNVLMELKSKGGQLLPGQRKFIEDWRGTTPVEVRSAEEALKIIGAI